MPADVSVETLVAKLEAVRSAIGDAQVVRSNAVEDLRTRIGNVAGFQDDLNAWLATFDEAVMPHIEGVVSWIDVRARTYVFGSAIEAVRARAAELEAPDASPLRRLRHVAAKAVDDIAVEVRGLEELSQAIGGVDEWFHDLTSGLRAQHENALAMLSLDVERAGDRLAQIQSWLSERCGEAWPVRQPVARFRVGRGVPAASPVRPPNGNDLPPDQAVAKAASAVALSLEAARSVAEALAESDAFADGDRGASAD